MGTWQLYVDESGDFATAGDDLVVAGLLLEGHGNPQLDEALRRSLERIFVGVPYPVHTAHHNLRSSLLWGPLRGEKASGPLASRFQEATAPAAAIVQASRAREAVEFLAAVRGASTTKGVRIELLREVDPWLARNHRAAHALLVREAQTQKSDLAAFLAQGLPTVRPARRMAIVAAFQGGTGGDEAPSPAQADARYAALYEALLERTTAFVAERDRKSLLLVHLAARGRLDDAHNLRLNTAQSAALAHPLLGRAHAPPDIVRVNPRGYNAAAPPGVVLADFAANRLRRILKRASSWKDAANSVQGHVGVAPVASCPVITTATMLPSMQASGPIRETMRLVFSGNAAPIPPGPRWAQDQARLWIDAFAAEGAR